jgi:hypothetical protein
VSLCSVGRLTQGQGLDRRSDYQYTPRTRLYEVNPPHRGSMAMRGNGPGCGQPPLHGHIATRQKKVESMSGKMKYISVVWALKVRTGIVHLPKELCAKHTGK